LDLIGDEWDSFELVGIVVPDVVMETIAQSFREMEEEFGDR